MKKKTKENEENEVGLETPNGIFFNIALLKRAATKKKHHFFSRRIIIFQ